MHFCEARRGPVHWRATQSTARATVEEEDAPAEAKMRTHVYSVPVAISAAAPRTAVPWPLASTPTSGSALTNEGPRRTLRREKAGCETSHPESRMKIRVPFPPSPPPPPPEPKTEARRGWEVGGGVGTGRW
jgi:hypothetical protein